MSASPSEMPPVEILQVGEWQVLRSSGEMRSPAGVTRLGRKICWTDSTTLVLGVHDPAGLAYVEQGRANAFLS